MRENAAERRCIVSRQSMPTMCMVRFVVSPEGQVVPDIRGNLPGRGAWVTLDRAMVEKAAAGSMFQKAFRARVSVMPDLPARLSQLLFARINASLAMARKAGAAIFGFDRVDAALRHGGCAALVHAAEAAADGVAKLRIAAMKGRGGDISGLVLVRDLLSAELSRISGHDNTMHAVVRAGPGGEAFLLAVSRYRAYEGLHGAVCAMEPAGGSMHG